MPERDALRYDSPGRRMDVKYTSYRDDEYDHYEHSGGISHQNSCGHFLLLIGFC